MREGFQAKPVTLNIINTNGGLGDLIARLPAMRYMHDNYRHVSQVIWTPDYATDLLRYLLPNTDRLRHERYSRCPHSVSKPYIEFSAERLSTLHLHLTTHAFLILMNQIPESTKDMEYPYADPVRFIEPSSVDQGLKILDKNETIIFTTDYTSAVRSWPAYEINALAKLVRAKGIQPVLLGKPGETMGGSGVAESTDGIDGSLFVDLRGKTTLIEALGVIQRSKAVVGVDNGLMHLAACTDVPIVGGYTTLDPRHRVPVRPYGSFKAIPAAVPCGGCQSKGFAINMDWRQCLFQDRACTMTMTHDKFYLGLQELGVL